MYDANKDGKSQGGSIGSFDVLPYFIRGTDLFVPSSPPGLVSVTYDDQTVLVPNWPGKSQGLTYVMFE